MKSFEKEEEKESVAVNVNMSEVIAGKVDENYAGIPTSLHEVLKTQDRSSKSSAFM